MDVQHYIDKMKSIQESFLECIDNEEKNITDFISIFDQNNIKEDKQDLQDFFLFLIKIVNYHHRSPSFFDKIFEVFNYIKSDIQKHFQQNELFDLFIGCKRVLLFLFEEKYIEITSKIFHKLNDQSKYLNRKYINYFYPEIKEYLDTFDQRIYGKIPGNFEELRKTGQNESKICEIIRNDDLDEFIVQNTQKEIFFSKIPLSIYETNNYLMKENITLIEYVLLFGSVKIFKYMILKNFNIDASLWIWAIRGSNAEIIQFFEERIGKPTPKEINIFLAESILCNYNDITSYFLNDISNSEKNNKNILEQCLIAHNFVLMNDNLIKYNLLPKLYYNGYSKLTNILLNVKDIDINPTKISYFFDYKWRFYLIYTIKFQ